MSAEVFLDTNILIYAFGRDVTRTTQAVALLRQGGTISVQVLNEFTNIARRKLRRSWPEIIEARRFADPVPRPQAHQHGDP